MTDLKSLENFLDHNVIPKIQKRPKTFLGIAKQPHYENVMSNIYAFFFKVEEVHDMGDLFIISLLQLIEKSELGKQKLVREIANFEVFTEVVTKKKGKIDLLLSSPDHAIIIENKVYHHLNNNLCDYWDSTKVTGGDAAKIGIVLSLNKINPTHSHFINITHVELLSQVMQNIGLYLMSAKDKYVVYLKDYYQNSINLSKSEMDSKELQFYFNHQTKILQAKDLHFAVRTHIIHQVEQAAELIDQEFDLPKSRGAGDKRLRFFLSPQNSNLMITVFFEKLLTPEKRLFLIVELKNDLLKNRELYREISFTENEKAVTVDDFYENPGQSWCHFASIG